MTLIDLAQSEDAWNDYLQSKRFVRDINENHDPHSGQFTFAEGGSPLSIHTIAGDDNKSRWRSQIDDMQKSLEARPESSYTEQEADAVAHIDTVLSQDEKAKLSQRKDLKFAYAEVDGRLAAAGSMKIDGKTANFLNLGSLKRGAGRTVMESLISTAKGRGVKELRLEANETNRSFYERLGFSLEGEALELDSIRMRRQT